MQRPAPSPKQRLRCVQCGRYVGRYTKDSAKSVELELPCKHCKGHTRFTVVEGALRAGEFLPDPPRLPYSLKKPLSSS